MPQRTKAIWTVWRKLVGNLLPLLIASPFLVLGIIEFPHFGMTGKALVDFCLFIVCTWIATNFLGNSGSWGLKAELGKRLHHVRPFDKTEKMFVGFSRPGYQGLLDPHEDVGFLLFHKDRLEFFGGQTNVELPANEITIVKFRANPHSWVGLGRWISVEGDSNGAPVRLLIEPREKATLIGNLLLGSKLQKRINDWQSNAIQPST